ncbi:MAG: DUF4342 domain-containing protein [Balneolaceae bacterium]|nr:MAG: DUF4342 domain-containing protein [Balneolaceae bacterium]
MQKTGELIMATGTNNVFEEIRSTGEKLIDEIQTLIKEGSIRRIVVKNKRGKVLLDTPLNLGAVGFGGLILLHPVVTTIGAVVMFMNDIQVLVEHTDKDENEIEVESHVIEVEEDEESAPKKKSTKKNT